VTRLLGMKLYLSFGYLFHFMVYGRFNVQLYLDIVMRKIPIIFVLLCRGLPGSPQSVVLEIWYLMFVTMSRPADVSQKF
jgi:hypothetical protein